MTSSTQTLKIFYWVYSNLQGSLERVRRHHTAFSRVQYSVPVQPGVDRCDAGKCLYSRTVPLKPDRALFGERANVRNNDDIEHFIQLTRRGEQCRPLGMFHRCCPPRHLCRSLAMPESRPTGRPEPTRRRPLAADCCRRCLWPVYGWLFCDTVCMYHNYTRFRLSI